MLLRLKNKEHLIVDEFKFKCSIGKKGLKSKKIEGDHCTPIGVFKIGKVYYRPDRVKKPDTILKTKTITKNMGWCDDPKSKDYNKLIKLPINYRYEKLYRKENIYDLILVLNFNMRPIVKKKGSAIFIHIAKKNYKKTEGCVAVNKVSLLKIIKKLKNNTKVLIENQK